MSCSTNNNNNGDIHKGLAEEKKAIVSALRLCPIFTRVSDSSINHIVAKSQIDRLSPGSSIFRAGDVGTWFYVLVHGSVESSLYGQPLSSSSKPGYIGGLTSTIYAVDKKSENGSASAEAMPDAAIRTFTHQTKSHVTIVKIDVALFQELSALDHGFEIGIMRYFSERLRSKNNRLANMMQEQKSGGKHDAIIISVFDTKPYDQRNLTKVFSGVSFGGRPIELHFIAAKLDKTTVALAVGSHAICIFVNDIANAEVLRALKVMGIDFILLRCAGFNALDITAAATLGISVARVPAYSPYAVAEHAAALLLSVTRRTFLAYNRIRNGNFALDGLTGRDLYGKTCGVIGTGKIGRCFAEIARGFGMKILLWDAFPNISYAKSIGAEYVSDFVSLVKQSDILSFHVPLTEKTHHLFSKEILAVCKPGLVVINTSRGPVVDAEAILEGLLSNKLGGAGLDVYENERHYFFEDLSGQPILDSCLARLVNLPNCIVTSHQAFLTNEALTAIAETTRENAKEFFDGKKTMDDLTNYVGPEGARKWKNKDAVKTIPVVSKI